MSSCLFLDADTGMMQLFLQQFCKAIKQSLQSQAGGAHQSISAAWHMRKLDLRSKYSGYCFDVLLACRDLPDTKAGDGSDPGIGLIQATGKLATCMIVTMMPSVVSSSSS